MRLSLSAAALSIALGARTLARPAAVTGQGVELRDANVGAVDSHPPSTADEFRVKFELEPGVGAGVEADIAGLGKFLGARDSGDV